MPDTTQTSFRDPNLDRSRYTPEQLERIDAAYNKLHTHERSAVHPRQCQWAYLDGWPCVLPAGHDGRHDCTGSRICEAHKWYGAEFCDA